MANRSLAEGTPRQVSTQPSSIDLLVEFTSQIDEALGLYADANIGMETFAQRLSELSQSAPPVASPDELERKRLFIGHGGPDDPNALIVDAPTQAEAIARNSRGGRNHKANGRTLVASIYQYWEDHYRAAFAQSLRLNKNEIKSDLFGDIRTIRNSIVHNKGFAISDITKCKVIRQFKTGDEISFTPIEMYGLVRKVRIETDRLCVEHTGINPAFSERRLATGQLRV